MALRGRAFIIMWHDISPEGEDEYHHWHSRQHMPERLDHPGFLRSRRGVNWDHGRQRYFTLYEGEEAASFTSSEYQRSLNGPTDWTNRVAPTFRNFLRSACEVQHTAGRGVGGALCTIRGDLPPGEDEDAFVARLRPVLDELADRPLVCGVHVGLPRHDYSGGATRETELRPPMQERDFQFVVIVESFGLKELATEGAHALAAVEALGAGELLCQSYDMAYMIEQPE